MEASIGRIFKDSSTIEMQVAFVENASIISLAAKSEDFMDSEINRCRGYSKIHSPDANRSVLPTSIGDQRKCVTILRNSSRSVPTSNITWWMILLKSSGGGLFEESRAYGILLHAR